MHAEDNVTLTRTGSDTPMGHLFRRFWMPALLSAELPAPDAPPVRVRLLGEDLVAFRDSAGRVGLLDAFCPHRRAELYLGRNEEAGLRCVYHGWKFDVDGRCVDMPGEDNGCELAKRVSTLAYPVMEQGGVVWAWMGPREERPSPPEFEFCRVSPDHVYISKCLMKCNYLQALEGSIDYSHISFLHKEVEGAAARADVFGIGGLIRFANEDVRPTLFATRTDYGLRIAARRIPKNPQRSSQHHPNQRRGRKPSARTEPIRRIYPDPRQPAHQHPQTHRPDRAGKRSKHRAYRPPP